MFVIFYIIWWKHALNVVLDCPRECSGLDGLKFAVEMATKTSPMEEIYCGEEQECVVERLEPGKQELLIVASQFYKIMIWYWSL